MTPERCREIARSHSSNVGTTKEWRLLSIDQAVDAIQEALAHTLEKEQARVRELEEALEPFAEIGLEEDEMSDNATRPTPETDAYAAELAKIGWPRFAVDAQVLDKLREMERRLAEAEERNRLLLDSDSEVFTERTHVADIQHDLQDANEDIACYIEREAQHKVALAALQSAHDKALADLDERDRDIARVAKTILERGREHEQMLARVSALEKALEPFAEIGRDLTNLICHVGLCQADVCSRCSLVLAARAARSAGGIG